LNRRAFFEQAEIQFDENLKSGKLQAVAMIDIDFFKKINARYGHEGGDVALKHFAALLGEHFDDNLVARMGGEEFSLLFTDAENVAAQCEAFRLCVEKSSVKFGNVVINFTISIGIASQPKATLYEMLKQADGNLYKAKETGRNRIVLT
jgi:diguanylate cyclase (GGDEF)-like protein